MDTMNPKWLNAESIGFCERLELITYRFLTYVPVIISFSVFGFILSFYIFVSNCLKSTDNSSATWYFYTSIDSWYLYSFTVFYPSGIHWRLRRNNRRQGLLAFGCGERKWSVLGINLHWYIRIHNFSIISLYDIDHLHGSRLNTTRHWMGHDWRCIFTQGKHKRISHKLWYHHSRVSTYIIHDD